MPNIIVNDTVVYVSAVFQIHCLALLAEHPCLQILIPSSDLILLTYASRPVTRKELLHLEL